MDPALVLGLVIVLVLLLAAAFIYRPTRGRLVKFAAPIRARAPSAKPMPIRPPQYLVRQGQVEHPPITPGAERLQATLMVARDHAVSLEDGKGQFYGFAIGPTITQLQPGITPHNVIITRPRYKRLTVREIQTKEGLRVERVDFGILYQIDAVESEEADTPEAKPKLDALYRAAYRVAFWEEGEEQARAVESWELAVQEMAKNLMRQEISRRLLENLFDPKEPGFAYDSIENVATANLQNVVSEWGVEIRRLQIDGIWMAPEHQRAVAHQWEMQKDTEAQAERIRILEGAKRDAWRRMALDIRQALAQDEPNQAMALRLIEFLKYLDTLVQMRAGSGTPLVLPTPSQVQQMMIADVETSPPVSSAPSESHAEAVADSEEPEETPTPSQVSRAA